MKKEPANKKRFLVEALCSIAENREIEVSLLSHDWIVQLNRNGMSRFVYGYNFDLNSAAAALIANDKCALSYVLAQHKIPHVAHELFLTPQLLDYVGSDGNWVRAMQSVERFGYPVVCKDNQGTGGDQVLRIENQKELESAFQEIHTSKRGLALSPYYPIEAEYRMILLDGAELLCYEKQQPYVLGNGHSSYHELIRANYSHDPEICKVALSESSLPLNEIPKKDSKIPLMWKHNLGGGAIPCFKLDPTIQKSVFKLSAEACMALGIRFACVDVIQTQGEMRVLEVNAGVMLETVSRFSEEGRSLALNVYTHAVDAMFRQENPAG